jgi:hypothetical protein
VVVVQVIARFVVSSTMLSIFQGSLAFGTDRSAPSQMMPTRSVSIPLWKPLTLEAHAPEGCANGASPSECESQAEAQPSIDHDSVAARAGRHEFGGQRLAAWQTLQLVMYVGYVTTIGSSPGSVNPPLGMLCELWMP